MNIQPILIGDTINKGDLLLIEGGLTSKFKVQVLKVSEVKFSKSNGTEIILNKNKNIYFNLEMYHNRKSWVVHVVKISLSGLK